MAALTTGIGIAAPAGAAAPEGYSYEEAFFRSADGTKLHADVLKPNVPPGERRPVLMVVTPYAAHGAVVPPNPTREPPAYGWINHARRLRAFERGYVTVIVDLRGFGGSEGCWDAGGPGEQGDVKAAVEWAASQPWSSGRVALAGLSYDGWTGAMALATRPRGLAAIVAESPVMDLYTGLYDQGVPVPRNP